MKHLLLGRQFAAGACVALVMFPWSLCAQEGQLIRELTPAAAEQLIASRDAAYQNLKPGVYRFTLDGYKTLFFNNGKNVQIYAGFKKPGTSLARINEWNSTKRYTRAYIDRDGDPVLEADLDLAGGSTPNAIAELFRTWSASVRLFATHIDFKGD
jgi:hypothetical protein